VLGTAWGTGAAVGQHGAPTLTRSHHAFAGGVRSCETGEGGELMGGPWLLFRAVVKFNSKLNSN
jgi:hypothetical protein